MISGGTTCGPMNRQRACTAAPAIAQHGLGRSQNTGVNLRTATVHLIDWASVVTESANRDAEAPADAPTSADEASLPLPTPKPGLLAELLEDVTEPGTSRETAFTPSSGTSAGQLGPLGMKVGWLVEWASGSAPTVEFPGNELGPVPARSVIPLDPTLVAEAIAEQRGVMLSFEDGRPDAPIITGLLQPVVFAIEGDLSDMPDMPDMPDASDMPEPDQADHLPGMHASVDGRRVEIEATDEIVLRCGQASIVLRRNGRVVIRGTYVETRSRGVNRIKGGSVQIN
jgi:hypothetical protein